MKSLLYFLLGASLATAYLILEKKPAQQAQADDARDPRFFTSTQAEKNVKPTLH